MSGDHGGAVEGTRDATAAVLHELTDLRTIHLLPTE
jgi:hypothetical protein